MNNITPISLETVLQLFATLSDQVLKLSARLDELQLLVLALPEEPQALETADTLTTWT